MSPRLPENAIVTSDSGSCANWYARDYRVKRGQMSSLSGGLASMGAAVPYAIGAKFAHPDRPVIALVGDGAMQMNNMAELITIAKYYDRWPDKRLIICVFNNEDLNEVTWEQRVMNGNPRFDASQDIPDVRYSKFAELIGLKGIYVDDPDDLGRRLGRGAVGRSAGRPGSEDRSRDRALAAPYQLEGSENSCLDDQRRRCGPRHPGYRAPSDQRRPASGGMRTRRKNKLFKSDRGSYRPQAKTWLDVRAIRIITEAVRFALVPCRQKKTEKVRSSRRISRGR